MHKWGEGHLHSGSKHGKKVKSQAQAVAIMLSEKRHEKAHHGRADSNMKGGFSGVIEDPLPPEEPVHRGLARGALLKASKSFREGEMGPSEFNKHIKTAHGRLQEPMHMPMPATPSVSVQRHTHKKARTKGPKHGV